MLLPGQPIAKYVDAGYCQTVPRLLKYVLQCDLQMVRDNREDIVHGLYRTAWAI